MKKTNKNIESSLEYDSQRETRVLLEQIHSWVKTMAEQNDLIIKKLNEHDQRFDRMESELASVKITVMDNSKDIKELKAGQQELRIGQQEIRQKLDTHSKDIEELKIGQQELKTGQQELKTGQHNIEQKFDTIILGHEYRLQKLEKA